MKASILALFLVLACSVSALASTKICFFYDGSLGASKGDHFIAQLTRHQLVVSKANGSGTWTGRFPASGGTVKGRDGKTYLDFNAKGDEGCNTVLADANLLSTKTVGAIKFRCRGEGYGEDKYLCRDPQ